MVRSENNTFSDRVHSRMESEKWIAIFFVVLMVGSVVAMGAAVI